MKKLLGIMCAVALVATMGACLVGCGSSNSSESTESSEDTTQMTESAQDEAATFDGSAYSDTGAGTMTVRTAGGTSENGNVPEVAVNTDTKALQIEVDTDDMAASTCTLYIDGVENTTITSGEKTQQTVTLQGDALKSGTHKVELVCMDGSTPTIYKSAQYKVS